MGAMVAELVPPPKRVPARYAVAALAGFVLVGGAATAMLRPAPVIEDNGPPDGEGVKPLIDKLNQREEEYKQQWATGESGVCQDRCEL